MDKWHHFIESSKKYYEQFNGTYFLEDAGGNLFINDHINTNIAILHGNDMDAKINFIQSKCKHNTIIFNLNEDEHVMQNLSKNNLLKKIGSFPYLYAKTERTIYPIQYYDNLYIERIQSNKYSINAYLDLFFQSKNVEYNDNIITKNIFRNDFFNYICYYDDVPAGIFAAVSHEDCAMIMNAYVLPQFRDLGIISLLSKRARHDASSNEIYEYCTIALSEYSLKTLLSHKLNIDFMCEVWIRNE